MNIWTPFNSTNQKLPVLVYIHGGAFFAGYNSKEDESGSYLAHEQNIIVVKMNYRLGVFGFYYLAEKEAGQDFQGNWAILDQRLAMKWIFENIEAFGGDPNLITLSGCSAGAQSAWVHMQEEASWPYFQKMISFSSPPG
jgi:para-nitrobenzyl esterase